MGKLTTVTEVEFELLAYIEVYASRRLRRSQLESELGAALGLEQQQIEFLLRKLCRDGFVEDNGRLVTTRKNRVISPYKTTRERVLTLAEWASSFVARRGFPPALHDIITYLGPKTSNIDEYVNRLRSRGFAIRSGLEGDIFHTDIKVLYFIDNFLNSHARYPSYKEIARETSVTLSTSRLERLKQARYITFKPYEPGSLKLLRLPEIYDPLGSVEISRDQRRIRAARQHRNGELAKNVAAKVERRYPDDDDAGLKWLPNPTKRSFETWSRLVPKQIAIRQAKWELSRLIMEALWKGVGIANIKDQLGVSDSYIAEISNEFLEATDHTAPIILYLYDGYAE